MQPADEAQIIQLFEDGDRAFLSADAGELRRIYADNYVQYDESGNASTRQGLIDRLTSGKVRFVSMRSTGRQIRLLRDDVAVVHGSEEDEIAEDGTQSFVRYVYMDVVMKHEGRWQIVASQLARVPNLLLLSPNH
jgi:ketosteroid isomerase-like protein